MTKKDNSPFKRESNSEKELPQEIPNTPLEKPAKEVPGFPPEDTPVEVPEPPMKDTPSDVPNSFPRKPKEVINPPLEEPLDLSPDFKIEPPLDYRSFDSGETKDD